MIRIIVPLVFTFLWFARLVLLVARDPDKWTMPGALSSEDLASFCSRQPEDSHSFKWHVYLNSLSLNGTGFIAVEIGGANIP